MIVFLVLFILAATLFCMTLPLEELSKLLAVVMALLVLRLLQLAMPVAAFLMMVLIGIILLGASGLGLFVPVHLIFLFVFLPLLA